MTHIPTIITENLIIKEITDVNMLDFYRLEYDFERNKYWGYDWRQNVKDEPTPEFFMQSLREDFARRDEVPMGIFLGRELIGEVVLHNFGYRNDCEVGVRIFASYEGKSYAREAVLGAINYAFFDLNIETVLAKCYKQNERSRAMLTAAGMRQCGEDDTFYYFHKTAAM